MKRSRMALSRISLAVCALALAGAMACEKDDKHDESAPPHDARVETGLQEVLDQGVAKPDVFLPGAIAHYRKPSYAPWSGSAGVGHLATGTPIRPGDLIRAGSVLKTLVATVTLQLVEEGTLSLDQTLVQLLPPEVTAQIANADAITLRMLLNHTSGVPEWDTPDADLRIVTDPAHVWTNDEIIARVANASWFPPGTAWQYSNTNYTLIGMVLDQAGGSDWREQVRTRVLERLGLESSFLPEPGDRTIPGDFAHGYQVADATPVDLSFVDSSMAGAAGGNALITTVEDLARFLDALLAGRLFAHPETLVAMGTMVDAPDPNFPAPHRYGLGLESWELGGTTVVGNSGGAAGYAVMMFQIPSRATTLVTAINTGDLAANAVNVLMPAVDVIVQGG